MHGQSSVGLLLKYFRGWQKTRLSAPSNSIIQQGRLSARAPFIAWNDARNFSELMQTA